MDDIMKRQIEFLFLDMEWNQEPGSTELEGREAIQIGVVAADKDLQQTKIFSSSVRLSNLEILNEKTVRLIHMSVANIMQGKSEEVVLNKFTQNFPTYNYIVVWTRDTYELFKRDMKKYKIPLKKHRVVILQEVLGIVAFNGEGKMGFESALNCVGIKYDANNLHHSKHDAQYLFQLFGKCCKKYVEYTALEDRMVITATGKIHKENCRYIKDTPVKVLLMKPKSAVFKGFTVCKFCGTKDIWNRLEWKCETVKKQNRKHYNEMQYLPLTEKNIGAICKHFQVSYSIGEKVVFVRTSFTSWIVCLDGNAVSKLFHENYKPCKNEYSKRSKLKGIEGYHVQKMPSSNFYRVICYIKKHDDSLIKQWGKRNRIEKIFDQIEEELEKTKNQIS